MKYRRTLVSVWTVVALAAGAVPAAADPGPVTGRAGMSGGSGAVAGSAKADSTVWLCRPGQRPNPCAGSLETTRQHSRGSDVVTPRVAKPRPVDCFYLYPTVSQQPAMVADLTIDPEEVSIAKYQAARFSQVCKVYAPMYRQVTLAGLGGKASKADREVAYRSALSGWKSYLRHYNHGRGVVLIGHSQGSGILRRIMAETVDHRPAVRRRMVSAILAGTSVAVPKGEKVGGDFDKIPGCTGPRQVNCVMSFATFGEVPPDDSFFGKLGVRPGTDQPWGPEYRALCTNPAALGGGSGRIKPLYRGKPFAGIFAAVQSIMFAGDVPAAATPWVAPAGRYTARCRTANGARVLMVDPIGAAPQLVAAPTAAWGLHLLDVNLPLTQLIRVVGTQIESYEGTPRVPTRTGRG